MQPPLEDLRAQIDAADEELAALLQKRLKLVARAHALKDSSRTQLYDRQREEAVMRHCQELSSRYDLPSGLLGDLLRRMLRESYMRSPGSCQASISSPRPLVIVGGRGAMGSLFVRLFRSAAYRVVVADRDDMHDIARLTEGALAVMISVPIDCTVDVIAQVARHLSADTVLCDLTSVKQPAMQAMLACHAGPVVGLHPMFGPDTPNLIKQVVVSVAGRGDEQCEFLLEQLRLFGARIVACTAAEHDLAMSVIQALRHFTTYYYGVFLSHLNPSLQQIVALSSPIYRLELEMVVRLFVQDPHLYAQIIMSSRDNLGLIRMYRDQLQREIDVIENGDEQTFVERFYEVRRFFGDFAAMFMKESQNLLAKLQDER